MGELVIPFRMSQQAVSKHLAYLERTRLIRRLRSGRCHICTLSASPIKEAVDWMEHHRQFWEESLVWSPCEKPGVRR